MSTPAIAVEHVTHSVIEAVAPLLTDRQVQVLIPLPQTVHCQVKAFAQARGISMREFIVQTLGVAVGVYQASASAESLPQTVGRLSPRETQVGKLLAEGLSNAEIAQRAGLIGERTIKAHISRIAFKLNIRKGHGGKGHVRGQVALHFVSDEEMVPTEPAPFSARHRNLIRCIVKGMTSKEIAQLFGTTAQTIKNEQRGLYDKCGMTGRLELTLWAVAKWGKKLNFGPPWERA